MAEGRYCEVIVYKGNKRRSPGKPVSGISIGYNWKILYYYLGENHRFDRESWEKIVENNSRLFDGKRYEVRWFENYKQE